MPTSSMEIFSLPTYFGMRAQVALLSLISVAWGWLLVTMTCSTSHVHCACLPHRMDQILSVMALLPSRGGTMQAAAEARNRTGMREWDR
mmetsp:Transcript_77677/g.154120  ORF Transcript_77677/g.154120 Transcript_77677/m.154120 type:complete len:89 (+) Transcript_77677:1295-1561(+)